MLDIINELCSLCSTLRQVVRATVIPILNYLKLSRKGFFSWRPEKTDMHWTSTVAFCQKLYWCQHIRPIDKSDTTFVGILRTKNQLTFYAEAEGRMVT